VNVILTPDDASGEIYMIAVDPRFQRDGVAATLTHRALEAMRSRGITLGTDGGGDSGAAPAGRRANRFCREADRRMWSLAEPVCQFTNAMLEPPPPHVLDILAAASEHQAVADAFTTNFADPTSMWAALGTESGATSFITAALAQGAPAGRQR
jgi:hypothetical protein